MVSNPMNLLPAVIYLQICDLHVTNLVFHLLQKRQVVFVRVFKCKSGRLETFLVVVLILCIVIEEILVIIVCVIMEIVLNLVTTTVVFLILLVVNTARYDSCGASLVRWGLKF